jgi:hypothetical protein
MYMCVCDIYPGSPSFICIHNLIVLYTKLSYISKCLLVIEVNSYDLFATGYSWNSDKGGVKQ